MDKQAGTEVPMQGAVSQRTVGAVMALLFFLVGVVMIVDNYRIGAGWAPDGPQSGYFPLRIGVIICVAAAFVLWQGLVRKAGAGQPFVTFGRLRHVMVVLVPTILFVIVVKYLGIYVTSALFIGAFMRAMDRFSWVKTIAVSVGAAAVLFWMFELRFLVPLPKGPLEALFGY